MSDDLNDAHQAAWEMCERAHRETGVTPALREAFELYRKTYPQAATAIVHITPSDAELERVKQAATRYHAVSFRRDHVVYDNHPTWRHAVVGKYGSHGEAVRVAAEMNARAAWAAVVNKQQEG